MAVTPMGCYWAITRLAGIRRIWRCSKNSPTWRRRRMRRSLPRRMPRLFDLDSFTELGGPRDLAKIFESAELIKWRAFRDSEDARYV